MRNVKKYLSLFLALVLVIVLVPAARADGGLDNFKKTVEYADGQFADVASDAWYAANVKAGFEFGLIKGASADSYNPAGNLTLAEAVTLAARLNSIYTSGEASFEQGDPWWQVYVDYDVANAIIGENEYSDYSAKATRAQFAKIFAASLPDEALDKINDIEKGSIPDVTGDEPYGEAVYKLYNAGILTGSDEYGTFLPGNNISRAEVAAITTRMADKSLRKNVELKKDPLPAERIEFKEKEIVLHVGESKKLEVVTYPKDATIDDMWWMAEMANDPSAYTGSYVSIEKDGTITVKADNPYLTESESINLKVTCHAGTLTAECTVLIKPAVFITYNGNRIGYHSGSFNNMPKLYPGDSIQLQAEFAADYKGSKKVTWESDDTSVATVSQSGLVQIKKPGSASITVKTDTGASDQARYYLYLSESVLRFGNTVPFVVTGDTGARFTVKNLSYSRATVEITFSKDSADRWGNTTGGDLLQYKVYNSEGIVVRSSAFTTGVLSVGDTAKKSFFIYELDGTPDIYTLLFY